MDQAGRSTKTGLWTSIHEAEQENGSSRGLRPRSDGGGRMVSAGRQIVQTARWMGREKITLKIIRRRWMSVHTRRVMLMVSGLYWNHAGFQG